MAEPISTGYTPRPHQLSLHNNLKRFSIVICHRRFGKTLFAFNHLIDRAIRSTLPMPRLAYLAPTYGAAKRISWDYLKKYTEKIPGVTYNEADLRADFSHNGARIMLLSAENPMSLKGIYLDLVVLDEFGEMSPVVWREVIRPTLSDRRGSAIFVGTVKGMNHFWEMYEYARDAKDHEWFAAMFKASETKILPEEELESARKTMTEEEYAQEMECDPRAGLVGAYFGKDLAKAEAEKRVGFFPVEERIPVDLYFDLGINDLTAVWFVQSFNGTHRLVDYYEISGASIREIVADITNKRYKFGYWVLPHDAKAKSLQTGKSQEQNFYDLGCRPVRIVPRV